MRMTLLLACLLIPLSGYCGNERLNYQGKLSHGNSPVSGVVPMVFQIYDGIDGTNILYEESMDVTVVDGFYSVELGGFPNLGQLVSAIKRQNAHMQVIVDGNPLRPREKVGKPPFAENSVETWNTFSITGPGALAPDQIITSISQSNHWVWAQNFATFRIPSMDLKYLPSETNYYHVLFPPPFKDKEIDGVRIMAKNTLDSGVGTPDKSMFNIVVRNLQSSKVSRILSENINLTNITPMVWLDCPLILPLEERLVNADEYLSMEFWVPGNQQGLQLLDVFIHVDVR